MRLVVPARSVVQATLRTRVLTLDLGNLGFPFAAGQAVLAGLADGTIRRPYSIASAPSRVSQHHRLELLVQIDDAPDNPHLERVIPGTSVELEGPFGSFTLPPAVLESRILFIAGGTGIAPLRSMLQEIGDRDPHIEPTLLYSARGPGEFAFLDELNELASKGRLKLHLTVTRELEAVWKGARGRIDAALIASVLKTPETRCFACGPPAFVAHMVTLLQAAGVAESRIQSAAE